MDNVPRLTAIHADWNPAVLDRAVAEIGRRLRSIPPGAAVAVIMAADHVSVAALLAARAHRRPTLLLPPRLKERDLRAMLDAVRPAVLIGPPAAGFLAHPTARREQVGDAAVLSFPVAQEPDLGDVVCHRTSGSLASPRLAVRGAAGIAAEIAALESRIGFAGESVLCTSSPAHSYGLIAGVLAPAAAAAEIALAGTPADTCRLAAERHPTIIVGLASSYRAFLDADLPVSALRRARVLLSAGAPLPPGLYEDFWERYHLPIRQDYGTTETGTIALDYPEGPQPATVGRVLSHLDVRVASPAPDGTGEVTVGGEAVAVGYLDGAELRPVTDGEGRYHTGDVGAVGRDGTLRITRRLRAPIMAGEVPVAPDTIERAILDMPGVQEVAVVSDRAAKARAVVVAPGIATEDIRRWCALHLPPGLTPRITLTRALPRSPAGKILYETLRRG